MGVPRNYSTNFVSNVVTLNFGFKVHQQSIRELSLGNSGRRNRSSANFKYQTEMEADIMHYKPSTTNKDTECGSVAEVINNLNSKTACKR